MTVNRRCWTFGHAARASGWWALEILRILPGVLNYWTSCSLLRTACTHMESLRLADKTAGKYDAPRFVVTGEISSIYKKNGKTRKVHNLILLPGLEAAERLSRSWRRSANIHRTDGQSWVWTAVTC